MEPENNIDFIGYTLIAIFLSLILYAGYLSYKSIDFTVLERLEKNPLNIPPPPQSATSSAQISTISAESTNSAKK